MLIVFCEKCSLRLSPTELQSGLAVQIGENEYVCGKCAPQKKADKPQTPASGTEIKFAKSISRLQLPDSATRNTGSHPPPYKRSTSSARPMAIAFGVVALLVVGVLLSRKKEVATASIHETREPSAPKAASAPEVVAESLLKPATPVTPALPIQPLVNAPPERPASTEKSQVEREQQVMRELQQMRASREESVKKAQEQLLQQAETKLQEHKAWFQQNSTQEREYRARLLNLVSSFPNTPAAQEARKLAGSFKLPGITGRFVRIENSKNQLMLAEVEVFSGGVSVAKGKKATQSATYHGAKADRALDGNTNGNYYQGSVTHTGNTPGGLNWWEVDLGEDQMIDAIVIWNRTDMESGFLKNFELKILNAARAPEWAETIKEQPNPSLRVEMGNSGAK